MPSRLYRGSTPPTRRDHLLAHPYELGLALFGLVSCLGIITGELAPGVTVSLTIDALHGIVAWSVALTGLIGNLQIIRGLLDDGDDMVIGWAKERTGLVLAITSWGIYAVAVAALFPASVIGWSWAAAVALIHGVRLRATYAEEDQTREVVRRHEEAV